MVILFRLTVQRNTPCLGTLYDQVKYSGYYMYTDSGTLSSGIYDDDTSFRHYFDSCGGVSGAPIYDNATGRVIGIHTWGHGTDVQGGTATKITTDVVALINSHI